MRIYHISSNDLHEKILIPKIPQNILTKLGVENNTIPRISFSPSISHSLLAIGSNRIRQGPKVLNVFEPSNYSKIKTISNKELQKKRYVPDADKTKEVWVINSIEVKYCGKIQIIKQSNKFITIKFGPQKEHIIKNYFWEFKIIDGDIKK